MDHGRFETVLSVLGLSLEEKEEYHDFEQFFVAQETTFSKRFLTQSSSKDIYLPKYLSLPPCIVPPHLFIQVKVDITRITIKVPSFATPTDALDILFKRLERMKLKTQMDLSDQYVLKANSAEEYFYGPEPLISYDLVARRADKIFAMELVPLSTVSPVNFYSPIMQQHNKRPDRGFNRSDILTESRAFQLHVQDIYVPPSTQNIAHCVDSYFFLHFTLYHGTTKLCEQFSTAIQLETLRWDADIEFEDLLMSHIAIGCRLQVSLYHRISILHYEDIYFIDMSDIPLALGNIWLYSSTYSLKTGPLTIPLDPVIRQISSPITNEYSGPVYLNIVLCPAVQNNFLSFPRIHLAPKQSNPEGDILSPSILEESQLSSDEKESLWKDRERLSHTINSLLLLLDCMDWKDLSQVIELQQTVSEWSNKHINPFETLVVLVDCADPVVRSFAVSCLQKITDKDLIPIVHLLVVCLEKETFHNSALCEFLLQRAWANIKIGTKVFWKVKSRPKERNTQFLLLCYLLGPYNHFKAICNQVEWHSQVLQITTTIKEKPLIHREKEFVSFLNSRQPLSQANILFPTAESAIEPTKCKIFDSMTLPVLFFSSDSSGVFRNGTCLFYTELYNYMLRIMDNIWRTEGFNLLAPQECVMTGETEGFIEYLDYESVSRLSMSKAGFFSPLSTKNIYNYLLGDQIPVAEKGRAFMEFYAAFVVSGYVLRISQYHHELYISKRGSVHIFSCSSVFTSKKSFISREIPLFPLSISLVNTLKYFKISLRDFTAYCLQIFQVLFDFGPLQCVIFSLLSAFPRRFNDMDKDFYRKMFSKENMTQKFTNDLEDALATSKTSLARNIIHI